MLLRAHTCKKCGFKHSDTCTRICCPGLTSKDKKEECLWCGSVLWVGADYFCNIDCASAYFEDVVKPTLRNHPKATAEQIRDDRCECRRYSQDADSPKAWLADGCNWNRRGWKGG